MNSASPPTRIVTIGGGSGQFALLSGLSRLSGVDITAVVSMVDSGGSTGRLRDEFGVLPPGDVLKCILALSPYREMARTLLLKRFSGNRRLRGHNAGNMLITMLSWYSGSFPEGIQALGEILDVRGRILPVTVDRATLVAELTDGSRIYGERAIDLPRGNQREKIRDVFLVPHHSEGIGVYPPVIEAIDGADRVVIGPGDLFTSIFPNLIVPGVTEALQRTTATLVYVVNIMSKFGETEHYSASDFVHRLEACLQRKLDVVLVNTQRPAAAVLKRYRRQKAEVVQVDPHDPLWRARTLVRAPMLDEARNIIRHAPARLAETLQGAFAAASKDAGRERPPDHPEGDPEPSHTEPAR